MSATRFDRTRTKTGRARALRVNATDVERKLWARLRSGQMEGYSFRRQHPVGPYIVDFYCPSLKLVIELDGGQHSARQTYDAARTRLLNARGLHVLRFWNTTLIENFDGVLETIRSEVLRRHVTPTRSASRSGVRPSGGGSFASEF